MSKEYLNFTLGEDVMREEVANQKDLEQFQNYSHANRQLDNQTLKKINKCRSRIFRAKSEKELSQQELSDISEKLQYAKLRLDRAEKRYQSNLEGLNQSKAAYNFCIINNHLNQIDFIVESIKKSERELDEASQDLKKIETQFKNLQQVYTKQTEIYKKTLLMKHMI